MSSVFFVTGSSRGLGRQIVEQVLASGHRVVATARNPRALDDLVERYGERVHVEQLDVTDPVAAQAAVAKGVAAFGRLDVVVNNAGQGDRVSLEDTTLEVFRRQIETNFLGTVYVTKAAVPFLREQGGGRIIQISSVGGRIGSPGMTAYQSAKWAVGGFSEALAAEVTPLGIKVTVVEPGGMRTDWAGSSMTIPPISEPYEATVGASARSMTGFEHTANGDPRKVAQLVLAIADLDDPPLRILAGSDAYEYGREVWHHRIETDAKWEHLSRSTDHDEAGDAWQQQRGSSLPDLHA
ncbi:SDR family NAD(P)-dependent oxidoreductase [Actinopolymorpha pittospori]|uniref:NAD(P)-dependent dehydrogenase (Short-subunit alcohol dehydrogenase family) n=1 Tax=Actinopolymorpha pittospori TaxID=648752 RepID=A0A927MT93_9ACTN|nr:SDR family NAD(P)-dependent oxidoreductase [Actinopolymorpha pittospori]MBE1605906.1 NAD(P)-dependent dehydrogenase (short-subunit alcohol dehydrogenase family) [Actinopolymorpha pittospori]